MTTLEPLMRRNFLEYASTVVLDRALPDLRDGLKPVQRRILHTLKQMHDGRFHKVANVIGETMKLHPHGDAAIRDALVVLARKGFLIDTQGNFGNPATGHPAAAARYIECRLSPLALETLFNEALTCFTPSYDGRSREPVFLPAKLPLLLALGTEGIAVGMATRILPHNLVELLEAQVALLTGHDARVLPDLPQGGLLDVSSYDDGRGQVVSRARIEPLDADRLVLTELPHGVTTESLMSSIADAAKRGKLEVGAVTDYTADRVEIEIGLPPGADAERVLTQLFAHTECEVALSSSILAIRDGRPAQLSVTEALAALTDRLQGTIRAELEHERDRLEDRVHWLTLERIFIMNRVYRLLEEVTSEVDLTRRVHEGMAPYERLFPRPLGDADVTRLLELPIRRISAFDLSRNQRDEERAARAFAVNARRLANLTATTVGYLRGRLRTLRPAFPRRSTIAAFDAINRRAVAVRDIRVAYDPDTGFFGSKAKGTEHRLRLSEFDRVLIVCADGAYHVVGPVTRLLLSGRVLLCRRLPADTESSFTVVYRDPRGLAWAKTVHIPKLARNLHHHVVQNIPLTIDLLVFDEDPGKVLLHFQPRAWRRATEGRYNLNDIAPSGPDDPGARLSHMPVSKIERI